MPRLVLLTLLLCILSVLVIRAQEIPLPAMKTPPVPLPDRKPAELLPATPQTNKEQEKTSKEAKWSTDISVPLPIRDPRRNALGDVQITEWPPIDITKAQGFCNKSLKNVVLTFDPIPPFRKGACGTPAPIHLKSVGKPEITISPPAKTNCKMAKALNAWLKQKVQPLAKKLLNTTVVEIRNIASYSCRNRYGNPLKKISEHAYANALDIASFKTADGREISILKDWGLTERDIVAKRKREEQERKRRIEQAIKQELSKTPVIKVNGPPNLAQDDAKAPEEKILAEKLSELHTPLPVLKSEFLSGPALDKKGEFLHKIHSGACGIFGTVLGPEANNAHRNHFHVDLAPRKYGPFCE